MTTANSESKIVNLNEVEVKKDLTRSEFSYKLQSILENYNCPTEIIFGLHEEIMNNLPKQPHELVQQFYNEMTSEESINTLKNGLNYPTKEKIQLRYSLILEELAELAETSDSYEELLIEIIWIKGTIEKRKNIQSPKRLVDCIDAISDLLYVTNGATVDFGFTLEQEDAFMEVHRSNMTKACKTEEEAIETTEHYKKNYVGVDTKYELNEYTKHYIVKRVSDNKVLKSVNYKPADLSKFIVKTAL